MYAHSVHPRSHEKKFKRLPAIDSGGFSAERLARMHAALRYSS